MLVVKRSALRKIHLDLSRIAPEFLELVEVLADHQRGLPLVLGDEREARQYGQDETRDVAAGSVVFVKAGNEHRFHSIAEELVILVFFAPAEYANAPTDE